MGRANFMAKEGLPPLFSTPKPAEGGDTHCAYKLVCDGADLEPARRKGRICKLCMDHRMAPRQPTGPASPPLLGIRYGTTAEAATRGRKRGGQTSAHQRRKEVPDEKLQKRSGILTRTGGTVMIPLPQLGIFKPVACVPVVCDCGTKLHVKREYWARSHRRPNACAPCRDRKNKAAQAEREQAAREAAEDIEGRASGKGRAA